MLQACVFWRSMVSPGPRNVPRAQTPSSSMSSTRSGHVVHATAEAAAGHRAGSHTQTSLFLQHKGGDRASGKGKSYSFFPPGEVSCSHTAVCLGLPAAAPLLANFSAPLLLPLGGWDSLLSSVGVEHHYKSSYFRLSWPLLSVSQWN